MIKKKIIYVSGTRADFGLMQNVLKKLNKADDINLSVCVTGMHLSELYGKTIQEIEQEFKVCDVIPVDVTNTTHVSMSKAIGYQVLGMTDIFAKEHPDLIMLLGDRGEMLAAAIAAVHLNIPIIHLHGGERSGTVDEMIRHAISKFSHYHFVATQNSKQRLIKMGEKEETIFVVGAPGLEAIGKEERITRETFCQQYRLNPHQLIALLVYHPVIQECNEIASQFRHVIRAAVASNLQIICLEPNSDAGGNLIRQVLQEYSDHPDIRIMTHLPRAKFIECLAHVDLMLGNSSSGIIEAASFDLPVINIGTRQNFRECSDNVIHTDPSYENILVGIERSLSFKGRSYTNVYGGGCISEMCYELIQSLDLDLKILNKCNAY